jgi:hypothetical protein
MMSPTCCAICRNIPFTDLPSEEEPAIPHQPSLRALRASADSCALCALILQAALEVRRNVENYHSGRGLGGFTSYHGAPFDLISGGRALGQTFTGNISTTGLFAPEMPSGYGTSSTPGFHFGDDSSVRPWLYGNWWQRDFPSPQLQLMGLGVRLAATPNIEDAEGNDTSVPDPGGDFGETLGNIYWHGSYLRIKTEDGMSLCLEPLFLTLSQQ